MPYNMEESERDMDEVKRKVGSLSESIKVLVRVRPLNSIEAAEEASSQGTGSLLMRSVVLPMVLVSCSVLLH